MNSVSELNRNFPASIEINNSKAVAPGSPLYEKFLKAYLEVDATTMRLAFWDICIKPAVHIGNLIRKSGHIIEILGGCTFLALLGCPIAVYLGESIGEPELFTTIAKSIFFVSATVATGVFLSFYVNEIYLSQVRDGTDPKSRLKSAITAFNEIKDTIDSLA